MKKLFAILLALVLGLLGVVPGVVVSETASQPASVAAAEYAAGYHARCRHYSKTVRRGMPKALKKALLLPMALFIGTASAVSATKSAAFKLECEYKGRIWEKSFESFEEAKDALLRAAKKDPNMPRCLVNCAGAAPITLYSKNWTARLFRKQEAMKWLEDARERLVAARIKKPQIEALMSLRASDLRNAVASRNVDKLLEIPGVGAKTAKKAIFALKPISRVSAAAEWGSRDFTRVTLNPTFGDENMYSVDTIHKGVSPVEAKAISLGGNDAIIHVVSKIPDAKEDDLEAMARAEELSEFWAKQVYTGIKLNDAVYVPLGHGTNAAKECKTLWVKQSIYDEMRKWMMKGTRKSWKTTAAKKLAYMCGLQSVTRKSCGVFFQPEDVAIFPSVVDELKGNMTKEFLSGAELELDGNVEKVNRSDGYFIIDVPSEMIPVLLNRAIERGVDPEEAEEALRTFVADTSINSYRCNGTALKGCGDKHIAIHKYLADKGIDKVPDGRPLNEVCIFMDETVLKTNFGENGAYTNFAEWCDAVREEFDLGVCVKGHQKAKKNVSYQVVQSLCEATGTTVRKMAQKTIDLINKAHYVEGASRLLNREMGHIMRILPSIANERVFKEKLEKALANMINEAFSGKLLKACYYAFITPDPFYVINGWFGLERVGCLDSGEFHVAKVRKGKLAFWRSPVMHPNSIRVIQNVDIKQEYRKYIKREEFVIMMNSIDDVAQAVDADFDGDHGNVSDDDNIIEAAEETQKVWNRLIVWETPKTEKKKIDRDEELEYFSGLTHGNELGITVYYLNALLNRIIEIKDEITGKKFLKIISIPKRGVNFKKFAANVLVDASKHGGAEIDEPEESAQAKQMKQPWAKQYRDVVKSGLVWYIKFNAVGETCYYKTVDEAKAAVANEVARCKKTGENPDIEGPINRLDELASWKGKNKNQTAGTLNKLFALYTTYVDRNTNFYDVPNEKFDYSKLMFNPEIGYRGLTGLVRKGNMSVETLDGDRMRPDEGLFNAIARRMEHDRALWTNDTTRKDEEDTSFMDWYRTNALAEIQAFAESMGKTLEDAYDVITWVMFTKTDLQYATQDNSQNFLRDRLWRAYWAIFGGMAEEAAERWEEKEEDAD